MQRSFLGLPIRPQIPFNLEDPIDSYLVRTDTMDPSCSIGVRREIISSPRPGIKI